MDWQPPYDPKIPDVDGFCYWFSDVFSGSKIDGMILDSNIDIG